MDPGQRGRGGYNRGWGGRGYRGQGRSGARRDSERDNEEIRRDYQDTGWGQANRGGGCPQRGGRGENRGGPNNRGRGYQNANMNFHHGPPRPHVPPPHGSDGPYMGPPHFGPNIGPSHFGQNVQAPMNPQQLQTNFPPNQLPPIPVMQDGDELEIRYTVKRPARPNVAPQQIPPQAFQQQFQQPNISVPPPSLLGIPRPQNMNQRSESLMNIRNPVADNFKRHGSKEHISRGGLPRSSSVQNVGDRRERGGARQNQNIPHRGRGRGGRPQQDRSYSQDKLNQLNVDDTNQRQREPMGNVDNASESNRAERAAGRHQIDRGRGRRRGRGYRGNNSQPQSIRRDQASEENEEECGTNKKEKEDTQRNYRRGRGRGRGHTRGRRDVRQNNEKISDTVYSDKEDKAKSEDENDGENSTTGDRHDMKDRRTFRGRGRGGRFYPRGSFRGRIRNRYAGRGNLPCTAAARNRNESESSDVSVVSSLAESTESESMSVTGGGPVRAGLEGIETISIQTLKNRLNRYRKKLNVLKKPETPDSDEIQKLQKEISEIDTVVQRRIMEEKESKTSKSNKAEEAIAVQSSDESDGDTVRHRSPVHQRRHKVVGSSKKGIVAFRPKIKLKGHTSSKQKVTLLAKHEEDLQSISSENELSESDDHDKNVEKVLKSESRKMKRNRKRNKNVQKPTEKATKDIPDWQGMLEDLCIAEPNEIHKDTDESKGAKPKVLRKPKPDVKPKPVKRNNESSRDVEIDKNLGMNSGDVNKESTRRQPKQKRNEQQTAARNRNMEPDDNKGIDSKDENKRTRSGSSVSDSSGDTGPDEIEVFKFIVQHMKGQGSPKDIQLKCGLLKDYQGNLDEWFKKHSRKFAIFRKENSIVKVCVYVKDAEYCLDYITRRGCAKDGCHRYHICKNLLCGLCSFGENCKFSHDSLDMHNGPISSQLGFNNVFNNEQIIQILSLRFPHVCECWNAEGSCPDITCYKLHICQRHVFGDCLEGEGCPFEHSLTTAQNQMVTGAYHMTKWVPKLFNKIIFVLKRPPAHVRNAVGETNEPVEMKETMSEPSTGIEESPTPRPAPRPAPRKLHTRPDRKACRTDNTDDSYPKRDNVESTHICEKQLTGRCDSKNCLNFHGDTSGLPYIWQVKLYGKWVSLPEGQMLKVEEDFCSQKEKSGTNVIASEDGLYQEYSIHFYPEIFAYTTHLDMGGDKIRTQARRLSTLSYAEGGWADSSFKTQWRWSFDDDYGRFHPFETDNLQYTLEKKFLSGQKKYLYSRENYRFKYCLNFANMMQFNVDTWKSRKVFRRPLLVAKDDVTQRQVPPCLQRPVSLSVPLPEGWASWDLAHPFELVELETSHIAYIAAEDSFFQTLDRSSHDIDRVYRVQNPHLWKDFMSHKDTMSEKAERAGRSRDVPELMLFHGTDSLDTVRGIAINNFDHRLSGKNATMYGEGAYFAKNAKYSHAYTKPPDRFIFIARVLVGEYTKGERSYKRPPAKPGAAHELYDSCVDNVTSPSIYIVFDTKQYYPEFLIQYHSIGDGRTPNPKPVIQPKPIIPTKPVISPKPNIYPQATSSSVSPSPQGATGAHGNVSNTSYPYPISSSVGRRPRTPSPPILVYPQTNLSYPSYPSTYPSSGAARTPSPPRQATTPAASSYQLASQREKDKSCVVQ